MLMCNNHLTGIQCFLICHSDADNQKNNQRLYLGTVYIKVNTDLYFDCSASLFSYNVHLENGRCLL